MPSNFDFLRGPKPVLFEAAVDAERLARSAPRAACFHARLALELCVQWLYEHDVQLMVSTLNGHLQHGNLQAPDYSHQVTPQCT